MARSSRRRRSSVDDFLQRAIWIFVGLAAVVLGFSVLLTEQPLIAMALLVCGIALPIGLWRRRRSTQQKEARMRVQQAQHLGVLLTVSGAEFEGIVADLFRALGYDNVERIGGSGDLGIDLTATDPDGLIVIIQCKRYGRGQKVGSPAIQSLMGAVVNHGADRGIFVTTSSFTTPARQHAETARISISLIDGDAITRLAVQASADVRRPELRQSVPQPAASVAEVADPYAAWPKPPWPRS